MLQQEQLAEFFITSPKIQTQQYLREHREKEPKPKHTPTHTQNKNK